MGVRGFYKVSHKECNKDLDYQSKMIIFESILTTFKMSIIVGIENWLKKSHATISKFNDDKFVLIIVKIDFFSLYTKLYEKRM